MRAWDDPQRAVLARRGVERNAQCEDARQRPGRRMRVENPGLQRPWPPFRRIIPRFKWQRRILMPDDEPIRHRGFIEERRPKWNRALTERAPGDSKQPFIFRRRLDRGD